MKLFLLSILSVVALAGSSFAADKPGKIEFEGQVQELPASGWVGTWKISGKSVVVSDATKVKEDDGKVVVGKKVDVEGTLDLDGTIRATEIETED